MKKLFLLLILSSIYILPKAQKLSSDSWKIKWNKKTILETGKSDEEANTRTINAIDLDKKYVLEISYKEADGKTSKEWIRSFMVFNESDQEIFRKDSTRNVKITATDLKKLFGEKKKIKIYTIAIPSDPDMAVRVRVRRVHLITLQIQ